MKTRMVETVNNEQDEIIYTRFLRNRDENDLRILLERYKEKLTLFIFGYVNNAEDAEDVMLDTFAVIASKNRWSDKGSSFKTWLYAIGRNQALMHVRKNRVRTVAIEDVPDVSSDQYGLPEINILKEEQHRHLYLAMERLHPEYRQVLTLVYFEEMSYEETARIMHKSRKQIYNLAGRGKERLKQILNEMGFEYAQY